MKAADYIRKYLARASLIVNLLLLLLTAWLLLVLAEKRESASLIPIQDGWARDDSYIGYMRQPKPMAGQDGPFFFGTVILALALIFWNAFPTIPRSPDMIWSDFGFMWRMRIARA